MNLEEILSLANELRQQADKTRQRALDAYLKSKADIVYALADCCFTEEGLDELIRKLTDATQKLREARRDLSTQEILESAAKRNEQFAETEFKT